MNIGIIGGGMIGQKHIENILKDGRAKVTWICTLPPPMVKSLQEKFDIPSGSTNYEDMLDDSDVDSVIIASPPHLHCEHAIAALQAGKHVMIEKPLALSIKDVQNIINVTIDNSKLVVLSAAARHSRVQPKFHFIKKLIDEGKIGKVYHIHHQVLRNGKRYGIEYNPEATWSLSRVNAGGGPMIDWGVYDLSFHLGLLEDDLELEQIVNSTFNGTDIARNYYPDFDVEEHGAAFFKFKSGVSYYYERATNAHAEKLNQTIIHGSNGALVFDYLSWGNPEVILSKTTYGEKETLHIERFSVPLPEMQDDHYAIISHFIDCVIDGEKPLLTPAQEFLHMKIINQLIKNPPQYLR
ncbi:Gfo/Idh/MocA family protein [Pleomorphochaeta sp. DL1XJH-081]|uniref:Gfo/Idh/MocA family protein n=1 Tax=Pleomorphochaeta sp. DL1XJH-081 TaxID=3409690 RepID=UPI003BB5F7D7